MLSKEREIQVRAVQPTKIVPITDTQAAIGAGLIISFFVLWVLVVGLGEEFLCWIGGKDNLAGWIQTAGVLGTLVLAIYLPRRESINRRKANAELALGGIELLCSVIEGLQLAMDRSNRIDSAYSSMKEEVAIVQSLLAQVVIRDLPTPAIGIWQAVLVTAAKLTRLENTSGSTKGAYKILRKDISRMECLIVQLKHHL